MKTTEDIDGITFFKVLKPGGDRFLIFGLYFFDGSLDSFDTLIKFILFWTFRDNKTGTIK
jgi:hypothetical protein